MGRGAGTRSPAAPLFGGLGCVPWAQTSRVLSGPRVSPDHAGRTCGPPRTPGPGGVGGMRSARDPGALPWALVGHRRPGPSLDCLALCRWAFRVVGHGPPPPTEVVEVPLSLVTSAVGTDGGTGWSRGVRQSWVPILCADTVSHSEHALARLILRVDVPTRSGHLPLYQIHAHYPLTTTHPGEWRSFQSLANGSKALLTLRAFLTLPVS